MKKAMIEQLVLGMVGTNTWLIKNKESNELLIIDPADESARIDEKIDRMGGIPVAVLLTHGHFDHMLAADDLRTNTVFRLSHVQPNNRCLQIP